MSDVIREIAFDTETTGLNPADGDRVIEIGEVEMLNHIATGRTFLKTRPVSPASRMSI